MRIVECEQGSELWWNLHRGIPTASNFDKILTAKTMKLSASCEDLICELIGQRATLGSIAQEGFVSKAMLNGTMTEPEARRWYEMERNVDVRQVGICFTDDGRFGASPDGLIGEDGGIEIKCPALKTHVSYLLNGGLPAEYKGQVHGCLIVTGRKWWDFLSYAPGLDPLVVRVTPNDYTKALAAGLEEFWKKYQEALGKIKLPEGLAHAA